MPDIFFMGRLKLVLVHYNAITIGKWNGSVNRIYNIITMTIYLQFHIKVYVLWPRMWPHYCRLFFKQVKYRWYQKWQLASSGKGELDPLRTLGVLGFELDLLIRKPTS